MFTVLNFIHEMMDANETYCGNHFTIYVKSKHYAISLKLKLEGRRIKGIQKNLPPKKRLKGHKNKTRNLNQFSHKFLIKRFSIVHVTPLNAIKLLINIFAVFIFWMTQLPINREWLQTMILNNILQKNT